jgi:adenosylcobinamide-phosphate guanylyltransferase
MNIDALIMAGGESSRFGGRIEKAVVNVNDKTIIGRVIEAARSAEKISEIYVSATDQTPKTVEEVSKLPVKLVKTDGIGYHDDLQQALLKAKINGPVLILSCDLPLLTGEFLNEVVSKYEISGKPALIVLAPLHVCRKYGIEPTSFYEFKGELFVVSGINVVDGKRITEGEQEQEVVISERVEAIFNVNTPRDLELAREIICRRRKNQEVNQV